LGRGSGCDGVGDECAEAEGGHEAGAVVQGYFCIAKVVGGWHGFALSIFSGLASNLSLMGWEEQVKKIQVSMFLATS